MIYRKTTKELLGESLHELSRKKSMDKITVREIVQNCGMSPSTFYRYFHDKYELIAWMYLYQLEDIFMDFYEGTEDWRQAILDVVSIIDQDRGFYKNAFTNTIGQNSFFQVTHEKSLEMLVKYLEKATGGELDKDLLFCTRFYLHGMSLFLVDWYVNDLPYSAVELTDHFCLVMPEPLKPWMPIREVKP